MTNQQHKLIQDVKDQKELTEVLNIKLTRLEGIVNHLCNEVTNVCDSITNLDLEVDIDKTNIKNLKNEFTLFKYLLLATATLTILNFIMLVLTIINL